MERMPSRPELEAVMVVISTGPPKIVHGGEKQYLIKKPKNHPANPHDIVDILPSSSGETLSAFSVLMRNSCGTFHFKTVKFFTRWSGYDSNYLQVTWRTINLWKYYSFDDAAQGHAWPNNTTQELLTSSAESIEGNDMMILVPGRTSQAGKTLTHKMHGLPKRHRRNAEPSAICYGGCTPDQRERIQVILHRTSCHWCRSSLSPNDIQQNNLPSHWWEKANS